MQLLSQRNELIGYMSGLSVILMLMLIVFSGMTAIQGKREITVSKISMLEGR